MLKDDDDQNIESRTHKEYAEEAKVGFKNKTATFIRKFNGNEKYRRNEQEAFCCLKWKKYRNISTYSCDFKFC